MKFVLIFFLSLCFHLLGGNHYAHASADNCKIGYSHSQDIEKTHHAQTEIANQHYVISKKSALGEENNSLIMENENEDEEEITRKHTVARYILSFPYAFISGNPCISLSKRIPFCTHLSHTSSCKYILQRVMRI
jgi:hypothetical protein